MGIGNTAKNTQPSGPLPGFREYPAQGFDITPPSNYWQNGNLMMPGISSDPIMTSNLASMYPNLGPLSGPPPVNSSSRVGALSLADILRRLQGKKKSGGIAGLLSGLPSEAQDFIDGYADFVGLFLNR